MFTGGLGMSDSRAGEHCARKRLAHSSARRIVSPGLGRKVLSVNVSHKASASQNALAPISSLAEAFPAGAKAGSRHWSCDDVVYNAVHAPGQHHGE